MGYRVAARCKNLLWRSLQSSMRLIVQYHFGNTRSGYDAMLVDDGRVPGDYHWSY
jgi:hypothetical protein